VISVRDFLVTLLTGLLLACPLVCGADEIGHGAQHDAASGSGDDRDHAPDQCPEGGDNCVCRGAVQVNGLRSIALDAIAPGPPGSLSPEPRFAPPTHHLTLDGSPTGLASWGESLTVRAYLQNFRF
jgi:hypothetical protein